MPTSRDDSPFQYEINATHVKKPIIKIIAHECLSNANVGGGGLTLDDKPNFSSDTLGTSIVRCRFQILDAIGADDWQNRYGGFV